MKQFENIIMSQAKRENTNATFPITMGANAFRGFLDEFRGREKKKDTKKPDTKPNKKPRKDFIVSYIY